MVTIWWLPVEGGSIRREGKWPPGNHLGEPRGSGWVPLREKGVRAGDRDRHRKWRLYSAVHHDVGHGVTYNRRWIRARCQGGQGGGRIETRHLLRRPREELISLG